MLSQGQVLGYKDGLVPKSLYEHYAVSGQGSGFGCQGSGVKTGVKSWSNLEKKVKISQNLDI